VPDPDRPCDVGVAGSSTPTTSTVKVISAMTCLLDLGAGRPDPADEHVAPVTLLVRDEQIEQQRATGSPGRPGW
jgi:hypothetical protein